MLVVTANWAFTDGTLPSAAGGARVARAWLRSVRLAAIRAGFGRDGAYRSPAGLDVVLAGDTFDCLVSAAWCGRERPWQAGTRAADARRRVLVGCARRAAPLLAGLATLARRGLRAPAPTRRGRPSPTVAVRVPVRVALLVGDRDRAVAEAAADIARRGAVVAPAWCDGTVLVRHGHEIDPACHVEEPTPPAGRPPTLAESVAVDLIARFAVGLDVTDPDRRATAALVAELAAAPPVDIPAVVGSWLDAAPARAARRDVAAAWRRAVDAWVRTTRREPPDCGLAASPIDSLAAWFVCGGNGPPPPALVSLLDRGLPTAAPAADGVRMLVLGHAVQVPLGTAAICLARPPVRRWSPTAVVRADGAADAACVAPRPMPAGPETIACVRAGDRLDWRRIAGGETAGAERPDGGGTVVDAA